MRKNVLIGFLLAVILFAGVTGAFSANKNKNHDDLYRQVELFSDTLAIIQSEYVEDTKPKDLIYGSLKGMLASLDPHSQFMDPETYNELKVDTEGKFGGLGIEITIKDGLLTVITPIEDTPAWKAGIKANDHIVKINGELTRELALTDAVKKMRGKPGEVVNLTVLRDSENKLMDFKIIRDIIKIKDIKQARILEDGIAYIRLSEFRENTLKDFNNALSNLSKQKMNSLILDLRNNPGGLLDVAVKIAGRFVPADKMIAYTKGRKEEQNFEFYSDSKSAILDLPMVVLINEGSASGSEIVAGVLQDYKRAIVIGKTSFGKGSVQTVIPLGDGSALRLTTSHYFTPSGKIIHGKGITPDILVEAEKEDVPEIEPEKSSKGTEVFKEIESAGKNSPVRTDSFDYKKDPQIMRALNTLKAIELYKQAKQ
ncbi:MAG: S41 family peptidase [Candidatus Omnitrophica bacterium]|jgi:carboxyl-terminal processing protease|nr:S41 family peptidase [Candidatus Omnitrophota bacterium]